MNGARTEAPKMYETENDISLQRRTQLNALMNQRLASAVDLQMQMKQAHWNVKGPSFIGLHELFDKVAEAVEGYVDQIAERIVQLGGVAEGTVRMAASRTRLTEYSPEIRTETRKERSSSTSKIVSLQRGKATTWP
jgi:starvation-inducible DNA-binding protein